MGSRVPGGGDRRGRLVGAWGSRSPKSRTFGMVHSLSKGCFALGCPGHRKVPQKGPDRIPGKLYIKMGVVRKQSIQNVLITYLGFFFGAINFVFLYTKILPDRYYGLVTFILAAAALLMPVMSFGVHNTLVKFYSGYTDPQKKGFLSLMLVLPLLGIFPLVLVLLLWEGAIENW